MKKSLYILIVIIIIHFSAFSQGSINDYKYIIIPNQYEFLKEKDQFQINSLTKFLFNKYGYKALMQDENFPDEVNNNRCLALVADVIKDNALFKTKLQIVLKDCRGNIVKSSKVGESREKEFDKAYNLALRDAFETFENLGYVYKPNENEVLQVNPPQNVVSSTNELEEISRLKEEIKTLKEDKEVTAVKEVNDVEVEAPKAAVRSKVKGEQKIENISMDFGLLYAQLIDNGFQIVDTTPKKVMILRNSGVKDVFTVEGKKAIVYKKGEDWMYSDSGDILKGEKINIKF